MLNFKLKNSAITSISSNITPSLTIIPVVDSTKLPQISSGEYFVAVITDSPTSYEFVKVTGISGNNLTVVRAFEGTSGKAFSSGSVISSRLTAGQMSDILNDINTFSSEPTLI